MSIDKGWKKAVKTTRELYLGRAAILQKNTALQQPHGRAFHLCRVNLLLRTIKNFSNIKNVMAVQHCGKDKATSAYPGPLSPSSYKVVQHYTAANSSFLGERIFSLDVQKTAVALLKMATRNCSRRKMQGREVLVS